MLGNETTVKSRTSVLLTRKNSGAQVAPGPGSGREEVDQSTVHFQGPEKVWIILIFINIIQKAKVPDRDKRNVFIPLIGV